MIKAQAVIGAVMLGFFGSGVAHAGEYCWNEYVQYLIVVGDDINFTTSKTCPGWCKIDETWSVEQ